MVSTIQLSERQEKIIKIVKENEPITSTEIAEKLKLTRSTIRPDLSILTMADILDARPKVGYLYTGKKGYSYIAEAIKKIKVAEVQAVPIVIDETKSLYDAIVLMFLEDISSIYVTDKGRLSGVVSRKDLLKSSIGGMDLNKIPVGMAMTRMPNLITVRPEDNILDAANKLIEHEVDSLPVIEEIGEEKEIKIVGRVTKTTITRLFVEFGKDQ